MASPAQFSPWGSRFRTYSPRGRKTRGQPQGHHTCFSLFVVLTFFFNRSDSWTNYRKGCQAIVRKRKWQHNKAKMSTVAHLERSRRNVYLKTLWLFSVIFKEEDEREREREREREKERERERKKERESARERERERERGERCYKLIYGKTRRRSSGSWWRQDPGTAVWSSLLSSCNRNVKTKTLKSLKDIMRVTSKLHPSMDL